MESIVYEYITYTNTETTLTTECFFFSVDVCHWNQYTNTWLRIQNYVHSFSVYTDKDYFLFFVVFVFLCSSLLCLAKRNILLPFFSLSFWNFVYKCILCICNEYTRTNISQQHWIFCVMKDSNFFSFLIAIVLLLFQFPLCTESNGNIQFKTLFQHFYPLKRSFIIYVFGRLEFR